MLNEVASLIAGLSQDMLVVRCCSSISFSCCIGGLSQKSSVLIPGELGVTMEGIITNDIELN